MEEYDKISKEYSSLNNTRPLMKYAVYSSFYDEIGDIKGFDVLDLACGDGLVSRELKKMGVKSVLGIDVSSKMIEIAKEIESREKLGIEYKVGKVGELGQNGQFDLITGAFLLHYSKTRQELEHMCADIYNNLKPGGIFIGLNNNSEHPTSSHIKYENRIETKLPLKEGNKLEITLTSGDSAEVKFTNYYWSKVTYEKALQKTGFKEISWLPIRVSPEGLAKMGESYWSDFLSEPFFTIIRTQK